MAYTFVAEGTVANVASGNISPGLPAGIQEGDLLIAAIAYRSNAAFTLPSGGEWTQIAQESSGNTSTTASTAISSLMFAYCVRGASDPNNTFTRTGGNVARGMIFAFRPGSGYAFGALDNSASYTPASNTTTPTLSGWTPSGPALYIQFVAGADNVPSSGWTHTGGSGFSSWTEQEDSNTTSGADTNLSVAWATATGTTAITDFSVTKAASSRHAFAVAAFTEQVTEVTLTGQSGLANFTAQAGEFPEETLTQNGVAYLMRDLFTTNLDPLVDADASEIGYRDVTGTQFYAANGRLRGGGSNATISYRKGSGGAGWNRKGGRTFTAVVSPWDGDLDEIYFHLSETAGAVDGYGLQIIGGSSIYAYEPDGTQTLVLREPDNPIKATRYQLGITLNDDFGAVYWMIAPYNQQINDSQEWDLVGPGQLRILYVTTLGTATALFPTIRNDGAVGPDNPAWEDVRLLDIPDWAGDDGMAIVADRFNRADTTNDNASWDAVDGGGVWGITSNQAYLVSNSGGQAQASLDAGTDDNVILVVTQTAVGGNNSGVVMNRVSGTREINIAPYGDSSLRVDSINGGYATLATGGPYMQNGTTSRWVVMRQGNQYRYWVNGNASQDVIWPVTDSFQDSPGTHYGISTYNGPDTGVRWDNIAVYPLIMSVPSQLTASDAGRPHLPEWTGAEAGPSDTFTNSDGTALATHNAQWSIQTGGYTIQSNRALGTASTRSIAYLDAGADDYSVEADLVTPGSGTTFRAGLIVRRTDSNNYVVIRLFMDPSQSGNDEIEVEFWIGGSSSVFQKCYLNDYYALSSTYNLRAEVIGDQLTVYLDDVRQLDVYLPTALQSGQYVGLYKENVDVGLAHDNFTVLLDAAGEATINGAAGLAQLTGQAATLTPGAVSLAGVSGYAEATAQGATLTPGAVTLTGASGLATATPQAGTLSPGAVSLAGTSGLATATADAGTFTAITTINGASGLATITGQSATLTPGSVSLAGTAGLATATPQGGTLTPGAVALAGVSGLATITGQAATLTPGAVALAGAAGLVQVSPQGATFDPGAATLTGVSGAAVATGQAGTLTVSDPGTLTGASGIANFVPQAATLVPGAVTITGASGLATATGQAGTFSQIAVVYGVSGLATATGQSAALSVGAVSMSGVSGVIEALAEAATFDPGAVSITGVSGLIEVTPQAGDVQIGAAYLYGASGLFTVVGQAGTLSAGAVSIAGASGSIEAIPQAGLFATISGPYDIVPTLRTRARMVVTIRRRVSIVSTVNLVE